MLESEAGRIAIGSDEQTLERSFPVRDQSDVPVVRAQAQRMARDFGLSVRRAAELAIVVSELASNIVKYGVRGEIRFTLDAESALPSLSSPLFALEPRLRKARDRPGEIRIVASDIGPPIHDMRLALTDGYDDRGPIDPAAMLRRGGLGTGLGAISRFADRFEYREEAESKSITVTFFR